jgi:aminoglycoside phosphotransferase family enzyme
MTKGQDNKLISEHQFSPNTTPDLVETHISWVLIGEEFVYKIKKPIRYSFLDFSTLEKRKYYCEREIELNRRLTSDVYLDVAAIREESGSLVINGQKGEIIDYAVRMKKVDRSRQMDILLTGKKITQTDICNLAGVIADFHKKTEIVYDTDPFRIKEDFRDLIKQTEYINNHLGAAYSAIIHESVNVSEAFINRNKDLLLERLNDGFFRDCHGDLHSRNIFFLPEPKPFDCIEFNDDYRRIDVLNEVAFLCMDLDAFGNPEFSELFINTYNLIFPCMQGRQDLDLFTYYKAYRANVRAKVNSLRARSAGNDQDREAALAETAKYIQLMNRYVKAIRIA